MQATEKPWVPNKFSTVCFEHFVDGFPSADHLDPELKLGYETKVAKKRKASVVRNFNPKLIQTTNDCHAKKSSDDVGLSCSLVSTVDNSITSNDVPLTTEMERELNILHYQAMKKIVYCEGCHTKEKTIEKLTPKLSNFSLSDYKFNDEQKCKSVHQKKIPAPKNYYNRDAVVLKCII